MREEEGREKEGEKERKKEGGGKGKEERQTDRGKVDGNNNRVGEASKGRDHSIEA